jgi:superfamily II DNA or RNA helicase
MAGQPELIDNQDRYSHVDALRWLVEHREAPMSVATGYVAMSGLVELAVLRAEDVNRRLRLLIGATPDAGLGLDGEPERLAARRTFEASMARLRGERDFDAFPESRRAKTIEKVRALLESDAVEVKRYVGRFLHGKAYIFAEYKDDVTDGAAIVTSANLTGGGLVANLELGLANYQPGTVGMSLEWFNDLWGAAEDFKAGLIELLYPDDPAYEPQTIFLRALWEIFGEEIEATSEEAPTRNLIAFQKDGYLRALRIVEKHGGVLYADGVGTGKTMVGLQFIEHYTKELGQRALVIVPAQMKRNVWQPAITRAMLPAEVISYQQLAEDRQLSNRPGAKTVLAVHKDAYRLVLIDEAHAFRNQDTHWYECLDRLLGGVKKDLVLLTATPVNNGLWDLYNLIMLFARHDGAFADEPLKIPSLRKRFLLAGAADPDAISEDKLFPLMNELTVRRDRAFLMRHYAGATFSDGTVVRFPEPRMKEVRYDLDTVYPGVFSEIVEAIGNLNMARYRPSAYMLGDEGEAQDERVLAGLIRSGLLKRFESCASAALISVRSMVSAHDLVLESWERLKKVPSVGALRQMVLDLQGGDPIPEAVENAFGEDLGFHEAGEFSEQYIDDISKDQELLKCIADRLERLLERPDPKLEALAETLRTTAAKKVVVFTTFGDTVDYLRKAIESDPDRFGGRKFTAIIGNEMDADQRVRQLERFCPRSVDDYEGMLPIDTHDEVDLLVSTDVVSEGQNLQEAQAVISYDMPWNPQRVVQRNGRIIRLKSPHENVYLYTLLPMPGELEEALRLEAKVRAKIAAANASVGMESQVLEDVDAEERIFADLEQLTDRIVEGDTTLLDEGESRGSSTFVAEEYRAILRRARDEGDIERIKRLPWGIGAALAKPGSAGGAFFAARTKSGERYWRFVADDGSLIDDDLQILRWIDPEGGIATDRSRDLESMWRLAADDICRGHNERLDPRAAEERLQASQRWALTILRSPDLVADDKYNRAEAALSVGRDQLVRRALSSARAALAAEEITFVDTADAIVDVVDRFGLRPVERPATPPRAIDYNDLGVVCWMEVDSARPVSG